MIARWLTKMSWHTSVIVHRIVPIGALFSASLVLSNCGSLSACHGRTGAHFLKTFNLRRRLHVPLCVCEYCGDITCGMCSRFKVSDFAQHSCHHQLP